MKFHFLIGFGLGFFLLIGGCGDDVTEKASNNSDTLKALPSEDSFKVTDNGLRFVLHQNKSGPTPGKGDVVRMDMLVRTKDRHLMNTFVGEKDYYMVVKNPTFKGDIVEILPDLSKGDSVTTKTLASYLYQGRVPPQIGRTDTVYTHFKIQGFFNEKKQLLGYINRKGHNIDTMENGLYRTFFEKGRGNPINNGDSVIMEFTGKLLDGTVFNTTTNKPEPMMFTYGEKDLLEGLKKGIKGLKPGAHIKLFMISDFGYGKEGARPLIVPYSPLVYDIKIVKVMEPPV